MIAVCCLASMTWAIKPSAPDTASKSKAVLGPYERGLRQLRPLTLQDLVGKEVGAESNRISDSLDPGQGVVLRLSKKVHSTNLSVRVTRTDTDRAGNRHVRLMGYYRNYPIIGSDAVVHVNPKREIYAVSGAFAPALDLTGKDLPKINGEKARKVLVDHLADTALSPEGSPELVIFDGSLAYHVRVRGSTGTPSAWEGYVDAVTGALLAVADRIRYRGPRATGTHVPITGNRLTREDGALVTVTGWKDATGPYFHYNKTELWGIYDIVAGDWEQGSSDAWGTTDRHAVSAAKNFSLIQAWTSGTLSRNSFNNAGGFAQVNVHMTRVLSGGRIYDYTNNAFWSGAQFYFGQGDGVEADPLCVLDVCAHEYGHALTDFSSVLNYSYESGALNESYSDIVGAIVEFWAQPDGRSVYPWRNPGQADWMMGEDCWVSDTALRDMRNPHRYGQPSYYKGVDWYSGTGDYGGVHQNSGVQNFVFYLLTDGGSGTNDGQSYAVTGVGLDTASDIALQANLHGLVSTSQYRDSRNAWVQACYELGHTGAVASVEDAWTAAGIPDTAWVDFAYTGLQVGTFSQPYTTVARAARVVKINGCVMIKNGSSPETPRIAKPMTVRSYGGVATVGR